LHLFVFSQSTIFSLAFSSHNSGSSYYIHVQVHLIIFRFRFILLYSRSSSSYYIQVQVHLIIFRFKFILLYSGSSSSYYIQVQVHLIIFRFKFILLYSGSGSPYYIQVHLIKLRFRFTFHLRVNCQNHFQFYIKGLVLRSGLGISDIYVRTVGGYNSGRSWFNYNGRRSYQYNEDDFSI